MMSNDQRYVEEQHTQDHNVETQREHQEEFGSDISIDGRDGNLLLTIRDISDNLNAQISPLEQLLEIHEVPPSISIVNEECQSEIQKNDQAVTLVEIENEKEQNHVVTADNMEVEWTDMIRHLALWTNPDLDYYFNAPVGDFQDKEGWGDAKYLVGCINIKEHSLVVAADMRKCKIYVFDSMPTYVEQRLVDAALEMHVRCIPFWQLQLE
ncbi:Ulp1-like peptidase [Cucumis melo var. makuwa]|uniref:Ulp1-like peptidase n=1 Tax=Cucumis melo var. makuwa TaxID=1194695 RepID=A0A5D3CU47_CUCMM|nr:Ulp1-like peptidase [Cucumis melo var. makuwa]